MNNKLLKVSKPLRYAGTEPGRIMKPIDGKLRFCLAFPDIYEIGMSHTGYKLLYYRLNMSEQIFTERFFAPWPDAFEKLGADIMVSLETKTPLSEFHILGFSMQYEMAYTTAVSLLKMADIPVFSAERGEDMPLIVAGGSCILNPAPLSDIIDVFFMGEMDEAATEPLERLLALRQAGKSRDEQLKLLDEYSFTYVPSVNTKKNVKKEIYTGFHSSKTSGSTLIPLMEAVQDRVSLELARGCTNGCRFCQAGMIYRPVREKSVSALKTEALCQIAATGYQELSLLSLDTGDYSQVEPLLHELTEAFSGDRVSLSLPSLRAETVSHELLEKVGTVRKSGFTIAPEAGSQRLRDIINKNLSEEDIINAALIAKNTGYKGVKLYFMCGLPHETDEDIIEIALLVKKIQTALRSKSFNITVSVSNFVPKAHTPFETFPQNSPEEFKRKHYLLREFFRKERVSLKTHDVAQSRMEAVFSRGDKRLGAVLAKAAEKGFYLDAWSEFFDPNKWASLFEEMGLSPADFASKTYGDDDELPWGMVTAGPDRAFMKKEREMALKGDTTPDCRHGYCTACGVCDFKKIKNIEAPCHQGFFAKPEYKPLYQKYRLFFEKKGTGLLMSALDLSRIFMLALRAAGVRFRFSEGFNPMPRMLVYAPMPVGVAGEKELVLFEAEENNIAEGLVDAVNEHLPEGLRCLSYDRLVWPPNISRAEITLEFDAESFAFIKEKAREGELFYDKETKRGEIKRIFLDDYLLGEDTEACLLKVKVTERGGFHFPEFFRKTSYKGLPTITRVKLEYYEEG